MVEVATNVCFALFHEIDPLANKKTYLDVNFLESRQLEKSKSEYPTTSKG